MEFEGLFCDPLSEVQVEACNLCALDPPTNPVVTACGHCFCWPCMYKFLQGQAKPCPVCSTMLSSNTDVAPTFDTHGAFVLRLPTAEVQSRWDGDDEMLDWSDTAAFACTSSTTFGREAQCEEMAVVVLDQETKISGRPWQSVHV